VLGFVPGWIETAIAVSAEMHAVLSEEFLETCKGREGFANSINDIDVPGQLTGQHPFY